MDAAAGGSDGTEPIFRSKCAECERDEEEKQRTTAGRPPTAPPRPHTAAAEARPPPAELTEGLQAARRHGPAAQKDEADRAARQGARNTGGRHLAGHPHRRGDSTAPTQGGRRACAGMKACAPDVKTTAHALWGALSRGGRAVAAGMADTGAGRSRAGPNLSWRTESGRRLCWAAALGSNMAPRCPQKHQTDLWTLNRREITARRYPQ